MTDDFTYMPGQEVYIVWLPFLAGRRGRLDGPYVYEAWSPITGWHRVRQPTTRGLVEVAPAGRLFPSQEQAAKYIMTQQLKGWPDAIPSVVDLD